MKACILGDKTLIFKNDFRVTNIFVEKKDFISLVLLRKELKT